MLARVGALNPNGVVSQSPRLLYSATLGTPAPRQSQPQRGCVPEPKVAVLRHQQCCKPPLSGRESKGRGATRNTTFTCPFSTSTRLTSARMISRLVIQSACSSPPFTLDMNCSRLL